MYQFDDFTIDRGRFELRCKDRSLRLERKPFELLTLLASRGGLLVTRVEMSEKLWDNNVFVDTEHGINTAVRKIRAVLKDDPENPRFIKTVAGMGYRFVAQVHVVTPSRTTEFVELPANLPDPVEEPPLVHSRIVQVPQKVMQRIRLISIAVALFRISLS
jgi:DNA-binding winged helix-turn-helix (wHTH) protein